MVNSQFLFIILSCILLSCSTKNQEAPANKEKCDGPKSLLLPEHQDTTTVFKPLPDSIFHGISYNNPQEYKGRTFNRITFTHLAKVTRIVVPFEESALMEVIEPGDEVKGLDGQDVIIKGFLLPAIHTKNVYVLSRHPYSNCFFCNKAGIESIMELQLDNPPSNIKVDQVVMVSGTFRLYDNNPKHLPYTLEKAEILANL